VQAVYPAQRLVGSYISSAEEAVASGKDVKDAPVDLLVILLVAALAVAAAAMTFIIRHHGMHRVYQTSVPGAANHQPVYLAKPFEQPPVKPAATAPASPPHEPDPPAAPANQNRSG